MNGNRKMSFRVMSGLSFEAQIRDCAAKAVEDEFGEPPNICEIPESLASGLPSRISRMTVQQFKPVGKSPPDEYWVGIE